MLNELINQYYEAIIKLTDPKDIYASLPMPDYYSFFEITSGLIASLNKEISKWQEDIKTIDINDTEFYQEAVEELKSLKLKKEICEKRLAEGKEMALIEEKSQTNAKKSLIFATTKNGNVYLEKDLKTFPEELYSKVLVCLKSLQDGFDTINEEKGHQMHGKISCFYEIKEFGVRVFYQNLDVDLVYVVMARVKKSNNDAIDREEPVKRKLNTQNEFTRLQKKIKDSKEKERLIIENAIIYDRVEAFINEKKRGINE